MATGVQRITIAHYDIVVYINFIYILEYVVLILKITPIKFNIVGENLSKLKKIPVPRCT